MFDPQKRHIFFFCLFVFGGFGVVRREAVKFFLERGDGVVCMGGRGG